MRTQRLKSSPPLNETVTHQLESLQASPDFKATPQQIAILKYVVQQTLAGNAHRIKGTTVATEVLGRGPEFDQSVDPVVSIQAGRLRRELERYYLTAGRHDPVRIVIPKGTYVPEFIKQLAEAQCNAVKPVETLDNKSIWPNVLVQPLTNLTGNPDDDHLSTGLTAELAHSLGHYREIRVLEPPDRNNTDTPHPDADFVMAGNVRRDPERITVALRLCDARKGFQIWSGKYSGGLETARMISFQERVAAEVAARVAGGYAAIPRHLAGPSVNKVTPDLTTYESVLRFWEGDTLLKPELIVRAIQALERAAGRKPNYPQTWSMLACLYANNYALEIVDYPMSLEKAANFARKGVCLDPTDRRARMILAYVRFLQNRLPEAQNEAESAYNLCPDSLLVLDRIGWLMALAGDWERGIKWVEKAIKLNPYHRPRAWHALILNWLRLENYEKAYLETFHLTMPDCFWDQILKATACGHLEKIEEGQNHVRDLLTLKPDFVQRGRDLINRFVKFKDLIDRILDGLGKLGLNVER